LDKYLNRIHYTGNTFALGYRTINIFGAYNDVHSFRNGDLVQENDILFFLDTLMDSLYNVVF